MNWQRSALSIAPAAAIFLAAAWLAPARGADQPASEAISGRVLKGRVVSSYGPVAGARVRAAGDGAYTLTDRAGNYELATGHLPARSLKVTAGKDGWFNNGRTSYPVGDSGDIVLNPLPPNDDPGYQFISPAVCARCHVNLTRYWDRSKMAHTTSNPKVLDMYYGTDASGRTGVGPGYRLDNPGDEGDCIACHAPSAAASARESSDLKTVLYSPRTEWDGISCDYCHKVRKVLKNPERPSHAAPLLKRLSPTRGNTILVLGPYDDVVNGAMAAAYSPQFGDGGFCAPCHSHFRKLPGKPVWDRRAVYSDAEWNGFGLDTDDQLPVQTTYMEWKQWQDSLPAGDGDRGKTCQACHMSWRKEMLPYDNYVVDGHARQMWGTRREPADIRPHHFDGGTATQLKTALSMEIEGKVSGNSLALTVYVTNTNGGHWVPTGETMRSVMLLVKATDSGGRPLKMVKGPQLPQWTGDSAAGIGNYAGRPGTVFAKVLRDAAGNLNVPFWKATAVASDTRIRPKKTVAVEFEFALEDPQDEPTVESELIYRPVTRPLASIKNWDAQDIPIASSVW